MMKLIINVDDFGMSQSINGAVFDLIDLGTISSTSVMVNMPYANQITKIINRSEISIGLHINITEGYPVSPPELIPSIVDQNGLFYPKNTLIKKIKQGEVDYHDVRREVFNQYNLLKSMTGNRNLHFDSHQGSTRIKFVYDSIAELVRQEKLRSSIRVHTKYYLITTENSSKIISPTINNFRHLGLRRVLIELLLLKKRNYWRKTFQTPDGMLFNKDNNTISILKDLCSLITIPRFNGVLELMCHPSRHSNDLSTDQMPESRVVEYKLLKSLDFQNFVSKIKLVNFESYNKV